MEVAEEEVIASQKWYQSQFLNQMIAEPEVDPEPIEEPEMEVAEEVIASQKWYPEPVSDRK